MRMELQEQQLTAALEALRQEQMAGGISEQEYRERAIALAQELGIDMKGEGNMDQLEEEAQ